MVELERMSDYRGVGLERFHCTWLWSGFQRSVGMLLNLRHFGTGSKEVINFGRFKLYCRNYTGTESRVLCRGLLYGVLIWESLLSEFSL